jgi:hypothetical protein
LKIGEAKAVTEINLLNPIHAIKAINKMPGFGMKKSHQSLSPERKVSYELSEKIRNVVYKFLKQLVLRANAPLFKQNLLYFAKKHQLSSQNIHEACDNQGSLIIILNLSNGISIGAFTSIGWVKGLKYVRDPNSAQFIVANGKIHIFQFSKDIVNNIPQGFSFGLKGSDFLFDPRSLQDSVFTIRTDSTIDEDKKQFLDLQIENWTSILDNIFIYKQII